VRDVTDTSPKGSVRARNAADTAEMKMSTPAMGSTRGAARLTTPLPQSHDVILLLTFPHDEQHALNRLIARQPHLHIRRATVVHVHTA